MGRFAALVILIGCSLTASVAGADWPGWRGPGRNGISPETGLKWTWSTNGPMPLWKGSVGKGYSSLAVAAGRVYTMGNSNHVDTVFCLEATTGQIVWNNGPGRPGYSSPVPFQTGAQSGYVFLSGHELVAAHAKNGQVLWKIPWRTTWDQNAPDPIAAELGFSPLSLLATTGSRNLTLLPKY